MEYYVFSPNEEAFLCTAARMNLKSMLSKNSLTQKVRVHDSMHMKCLE